jgi:hypothetical protein
MAWIDRFKRWAKTPPPPPGKLPSGALAAALNADTVVVIAIDSNGYIHQMNGGQIIGADWTRVLNPRASILSALDTLNVPPDEEQAPHISFID